MKRFLRTCVLAVLMLYCLPFRLDVVPPYEPVVKLDPTSAQCIAVAIWHEARGEPIEGQRAVLDVILHRKLQSKKSACAVIAMPKQFSFFTGEWTPTTPAMRRLLEKVKAHPPILKDKNTLYFYSLTALKNPPRWAAAMNCKPIGNHAFCALKGNT